MKQLINQTLHSFSALFIISMLISFNTGFAQQYSGWVKQAFDDSCYYLGVYFTNSQTGFAVGGWGASRIFKTKDAGITWNQLIHPEVNNWLTGVCFADSMHGWVVGYESTILHTTDGGNKWTRQPYEQSSEFLESVFCLDTNTAWATGSNGTILHTTNGGDTWTQQISGQSMGMFDIFFTDADTGFAVGGYCDGCAGSPIDYILRNTNGGATWTTVHKSDTVIGYYGVDFADSKTGVVVGSDGIILRTTDGGMNWTSRASGTTEELNDVCFINADTGYVVGGEWDYSKGGIILRTEDGGKTWGKQVIPVNHSLNDIYFTSDSTGFAVGYESTILRTTDGGGAVTPVDTTVTAVINVTGQSNITLWQNYPNPFSQSTTIRFTIPNQERVTLKVYDLLGKEVYILVDEELEPGSHEVTWNAQDYPGGIYFYRLETGKFTENKKLILLK